MKNISIMHVYDGTFFKNDVQYKYEGCANLKEKYPEDCSPEELVKNIFQMLHK
jgi:hypothetical protein